MAKNNFFKKAQRFLKRVFGTTTIDTVVDTGQKELEKEIEEKVQNEDLKAMLFIFSTAAAAAIKIKTDNIADDKKQFLELFENIGQEMLGKGFAPLLSKQAELIKSRFPPTFHTAIDDVNENLVLELEKIIKEINKDQLTI